MKRERIIIYTSLLKRRPKIKILLDKIICNIAGHKSNRYSKIDNLFGYCIRCRTITVKQMEQKRSLRKRILEKTICFLSGHKDAEVNFFVREGTENVAKSMFRCLRCERDTLAITVPHKITVEKIIYGEDHED